MELNKTRCNACGHINRRYGYKWPSTPERQEHNRKNATECPQCGSKDVGNHEDRETMGPYDAAVDALFGSNDS